MQPVDDEHNCILDNENTVGLVIHEEEGEVARLAGDEITFDQIAMYHYIQTNEPVSLSQISGEFDTGGRQIVACLHELFQSGQLYEPQPDQIRVVPEVDDGS